MEDENKVNIKLELNKDKNQNLSIIAYFNPNSSNFFKEGEYFRWKPTLKEKELIIDAFRLIVNSYAEKTEDEKVFKFSDKISEVTNDSENLNNIPSKSIETNDDEINNIDNKQEKLAKNHEIIINETVKKNKIKENNLSEDETERKIEKILRDNKKI